MFNTGFGEFMTVFDEIERSEKEIVATFAVSYQLSEFYI